MDVTVTCSSTGHVVVVSLEGEHDAASVPRVEKALTDALAAGAHLVVVELSGCTSLDSAVIGALLAGAVQAQENAVGFVTINATPEVGRVLTLAGVDEALGLGAAKDRYKHGSVLFPPKPE